MLSQRLDGLMLKVKQKQIADDRKAQKIANCGHDLAIERLNSQVKGREDDIRKVRDRMEQQTRLKEREIVNTQEKIQQSKKELVMLSKRAQMTESERIVDLE